jgi:hypothetical protein
MPYDPQVYRLASIARDKLCREAARASHNLRVLVAHANLLDELLIGLNAPGGASMEYYGFDLLPHVRTERTARRPTVREAGELELDNAEHSRHLGSASSPGLGLPMLSHDLESESDSSSDSDESDDSDNFETVITPDSPTESSNISMSSEDGEEPDESGLRHTNKPAWRPFGSRGSTSDERQRRKNTTSITTVTNDVERLRLLTT